MAWGLYGLCEMYCIYGMIFLKELSSEAVMSEPIF